MMPVAEHHARRSMQRLWMMLRNRQLAEDFNFVVDGDVGVASSLSF